MSDAWVNLGIGIFLLLIFTKVLINLAEKLSGYLKISPLIIGITVVALGTSLPELSVSSIAAFRHDAGLALGNIFGSNITNILLVFPLGIFVGRLRIGTTKTQKNALILYGSTLFYLVLNFLAIDHYVRGFILISLSLVLTITEYQWAISARKHEDAKFAKNIRLNFSFFDLVRLIGSVSMIIYAGVLVVTSVETISLLTGYSTNLLGLTLTAVATSLPELFATVFSIKNNEEKLTIGNLIGSNLYNLLFIGGVISLISPVTYTAIREWIVLLFATITLVIILKAYSGSKVPRWIGFILLIFFGIYLIILNANR